jgi:TrmH family RNA methyltransferase
MHRQETIERFRTARSHPRHAVLEGFHPVKHALRFGGELLEVLSPEPGEVLALARELAPDLEETLAARLEEVPGSLYRELAPVPPDSGLIALARRPASDPADAADDPSPAPLVFLERPTDLGNLGAVVRVAAAAGAAGVLVSGPHDPWHASALRGSAGLHYAVPVGHVEGLPGGGRPVVASDPGGEPFDPAALPPRPVLAFGSERRGLAADTLERADLRVRIPMRPGVSSLNLATSVAVILYGWRLARRGG